MTKRESVLQAIIAALAGTTGVSTRIYRSRTVALSKAESPAIVVRPVIDNPTDAAIPRLQWSLDVSIDVIVRQDPADETADPIIESLHSKLMADVTLGGVSMDIQPGHVNFELIDADGGGGIIQLNYQVIYQTLREDLTTV